MRPYNTAGTACEKPVSDYVPMAPPQFAKGQLAGAEIKGRTSIDDVYDTLSDLGRLCDRILTLADRVCGANPELCDDGAEEVASGVLPQLSQASTRANRRMTSAREALHRLELSFP